MRRAFPAILVVLAMTGCVSLSNTPQQERVYARYEQVCREKFPQFSLERVYPNGSFRVAPLTGTAGFGEFVHCMTGSTNWIAQ